MKQINKFSLLAAILFSSVAARAQLDSCNVFLKGNYVEIGINPIGAYGSTSGAPAGYHPTDAGLSFYNMGCGSASVACPRALGFVADPEMTGWTHYYGDFYVPGTPQEGWSLQVGSNSVTAYTPSLQSVATFPFTGANVSYNATGGLVTGVWQGMYDSIQITQTTYLDTGALFFRTNVQLTNLSYLPKDSVYYMRTIDPDNEEILTSSFTTDNNIEHQVSDTSDLVIVSARGTTYTNAYMALAAHDSRAKCFIADFGLTPSVSISSIWDQSTTYLYNEGANLVSDVGIGMVFKIGHLASVDSASDSVGRKSPSLHPANSASFTFMYAFKNGVADTAGASHTDTVTNINAVTNNSNITISPNPASQWVTIGGVAPEDMINICDLTGKEVLHIRCGAQSAGADISGLQSGIYLLIVKNKDGVVKNRTKLQKL